MSRYEYKVIPAPRRGQKAKGLKTEGDRFAHAVAGVMNELGADGWEYLRADMLPCEERTGLTSRTTVFHHVLVFRRELAAPVARSEAPAQSATPAPSAAPVEPAAPALPAAAAAPAAATAVPAPSDPTDAAAIGATLTPAPLDEAAPDAGDTAARPAAALVATKAPMGEAPRIVMPADGQAPRVGPAKDSDVAAE